jgi:hypothetical protein
MFFDKQSKHQQQEYLLQQWLNKYYGWWDSSQKQDELPTIVGAMTLEATRSLA